MTTAPPTTPTTPPTPPTPAAPPTRPVLGIVLAALALGVLTLGVVTGAAWLTRETRTESTTAVASDTIRFRGDAGALTLTEADRADVEVVWEATAPSWRDVEVTVEEVAGVLEVRVDCPQGIMSLCSARTEITVPAGSLAALDVEVAAGAVRVVGIAADLTLTTDAGAIVLADHRGDRALLRTDAGRVEVDARTAPTELDVLVGAGDVEISLPDGDYDVDASTDLGSAATSVRQVDGAAHRVIAHTNVGDVDVIMR